MSLLYNEKHARPLHIAAVTIQCDRDPTLNRAKLARAIETTMLAHPETRLIVFGEMILGWYELGGDYPRQISEPIPGESTRQLAGIARQHGIYLCFGMSELDQDTLYNSQVLLDPQGGIQAVHRKRNLKPYEKQAAYQPGETRVTVATIDGIHTGIVICADAADPRTMLALMRERLDLIILSLADDKDEAWFVAKANARLYGAWVVTANRYGQEHAYWNGHTVISDPLGRLRATSLDREAVLAYELKFALRQPWFQRVIRRGLVAAPLPWHILKHWKIFMSYYR